jgi:predicted dehydrogenase
MNMPNVKKTSDEETRSSSKRSAKKVRYAVVGLGYFSQSAILPAFANAGKNSELAALVSDDPEKLKKLGKKYGVKKLCDYSEYPQLLTSGEIDAVYIALPNDMHREYSVRASKVGIHALVEKPMALTERDCEEMIRAANEHHALLMVAYRLHLESANLKAIETLESGKIGEARFFNSAFSMQVKEDNIRVKTEHGGGSVYDLGIYCINAARYLFQDEPFEVTAFSSSKPDDPRFKEVDEMTSVIMRFPGDRQASFTSSFGAADLSWYSVVGTQGDICLDNAYDFSMPATLSTTVGGKTQSKEFPEKDQVAAEILYFSDCVLKGQEPEPSGLEGLADVRIIRAIYESAMSGKPVKIERVEKRTRPAKDMEIKKPPADKPTELFHAESPTQD